MQVGLVTFACERRFRWSEAAESGDPGCLSFLTNVMHAAPMRFLLQYLPIRAASFGLQRIVFDKRLVFLFGGSDE